MSTIIPVARHADVVCSRPLKTGESYTLVAAEPVLRYLAFDKTDYASGEAAKLRVDGAHLVEPLEIVVEANDGAGWIYADTLTAEPVAGGTSAVAQWRIPSPAAPRAVAGPETRPDPAVAVTEVKFTDGDDLANSPTAWMKARFQGLEGEQVHFILERENEDGGFVQVGEATSTVHGDEARAGVSLQGG